MTIWKDVVGYEGLYKISNKGDVIACAKERIKVRNRKTVVVPYKEKVLNKEKTIYGYERVSLTKNEKSKHLAVHRLVAEAFIENAYGKPCINHKNGIKNDNRIENLEWVTYKENSKHALDTGLYVVTDEMRMKSSINSRGVNNPTFKYITAYNPQTNERYEKITSWDLAKILNCHKGSVHRCARKKFKTLKGFIIDYLPKGLI